MPPESQSDLNWLAFRYISGEASAEESEAFEARLSLDQSAREAVAKAVELAGAVAEVAPASLAARSRWTVPAWVRAAAACLALAAGLAAWSLRPRVAAPGEGLLALTWSGIHQNAADENNADDLLAWLEERSSLQETDLLTNAETNLDAAGELPTWLLDAAALRDEMRGAESDRKEN